MVTTYRCTCAPGSTCAACRAWARSHRSSNPTGFIRQDESRKSPRMDGGGTREGTSRISTAMTREEVLAAIGAWVRENQRLPISTDWRKGSMNRPPLNASRVYDHWSSMEGFWEACVANGYATKRMLQAVRLISGQGRRATEQGLRNALATRRHHDSRD